MEIWLKVFEIYNNDWSSEQISLVLKLQGICVSHVTIYRRIYAEILTGQLKSQGKLFSKSSLIVLFFIARSSGATNRSGELFYGNLFWEKEQSVLG